MEDSIRRKLRVGEKLLIRRAGAGSSHSETITEIRSKGVMTDGSGYVPFAGSIFCQVDPRNGNPYQMIEPDYDLSDTPEDTSSGEREKLTQDELTAFYHRLEVAVKADPDAYFVDIYKRLRAETPDGRAPEASSSRWHLKKNGLPVVAVPREVRDKRIGRNQETKNGRFYLELEAMVAADPDAYFVDLYNNLAGRSGADVPSFTASLEYLSRRDVVLRLLTTKERSSRANQAKEKTKKSKETTSMNHKPKHRAFYDNLVALINDNPETPFVDLFDAAAKGLTGVPVKASARDWLRRKGITVTPAARSGRKKGKKQTDKPAAPPVQESDSAPAGPLPEPEKKPYETPVFEPVDRDRAPVVILPEPLEPGDMDMVASALEGIARDLRRLPRLAARLFALIRDDDEEEVA